MVGKVDEILGPINQVYFTIKPTEGIVATSFKEGDKFYIGGDKLLPLDRYESTIFRVAFCGTNTSTTDSFQSQRLPDPREPEVLVVEEVVPVVVPEVVLVEDVEDSHPEEEVDHRSVEEVEAVVEAEDSPVVEAVEAVAVSPQEDVVDLLQEDVVDTRFNLFGFAYVYFFSFVKVYSLICFSFREFVKNNEWFFLWIVLF